MPYFLVVAGPNGAGKSSFSSFFSRPGTLIFDPDKEKLKIERQYPDIAPDAVESAVTLAYKNFELKAIGSHLDLTVETNLRNEFVAERADEFRAIGYETRLVYMLLPDVETSMARVNQRVSQKGHFVDAESITVNFKTGLENLKTFAGRFDQVMLVSGLNQQATATQPQLLLTIKAKETRHKSNDIPQWCEDIVNEIEALMTSNRDRGRGY